jgi:hypothetical protein
MLSNSTNQRLVHRLTSVIGAGLVMFTVACGSGFKGGPVAKLNWPTGDFADRQGDGVSVGAQGELKLVTASIIGEVDWTRFSGIDVNGAESDAVSFWETALGGRLYFGPLYAGGLIGQRSGDNVRGQTLVEPEAGLRLGPLNAFGRYQLIGDDRWWSLGASFSLF